MVNNVFDGVSLFYLIMAISFLGYYYYIMNTKKKIFTYLCYSKFYGFLTMGVSLSCHGTTYGSPQGDYPKQCNYS